MSIDAWVTDLAGNEIAHLDRSTESPFRRFQFSRELNVPGMGALEYHLDNALVASHDDLFAFDNLVWMRYRNITKVWLIEERSFGLDENEKLTDWVKVAGRGVLQLVGDRIVWPTNFDEGHTDPTQWGVGGYKSTLDGSAVAGQPVVPVTATTGVSVGLPVQITGGGHQQIGIVASLVVGVSVTLEQNLSFTFPVGSRIVGAAAQWRRFVNRAAGEMLWDLISESNARFTADTGQLAIPRGTVESTGADGWTQDLRFDNQLDIVKSVTDVYGDVEMDGLTFNYRKVQGVDRTDSQTDRPAVIFEEGADLQALNAEESVRDTITWLVAEGTGEAVYAKVTLKKKPKRRKRKTPVRHHKKPKKPVKRKAPPAPKKVELQRVDFPIFATAEEENHVRRREAYVDAKDVATLALLDEQNRAALDADEMHDSVGFTVLETRYLAEIDWDLGDWVTAFAPSLAFHEDARIVAMYYSETDDEKVVISVDVNSTRAEHMLELQRGAKATSRSLGVQNRQPQGSYVPFSFSGADVFDDTDTMDVFISIPDEMYVCTRSRARVQFRQFFAAAKSAAADAGSTSGASSASSSGASSASTTASGAHQHQWAAYIDDTPGVFTKRELTTWDSGLGTRGINIEVAAAVNLWTNNDLDHTHGMAHTHGIAHTHTVAAHTHPLVYGVFKEGYPASHSVAVKVYSLDTATNTWTLLVTLPSITADFAELDLSAYITGPGDWRLSFKSDAAQPNGGRLGCDVFGHVLGAIQAA